MHSSTSAYNQSAVYNSDSIREVSSNNNNNKNQLILYTILEAFQDCEDCKKRVKSALVKRDFAGQTGLDNVHTEPDFL